MDWFTYEPPACYVFDRGYFDLARLYEIEKSNAFFIIREKKRPKYEILDGEDLMEGEDNVLLDQTVAFTKKKTDKTQFGQFYRLGQLCPFVSFWAVRPTFSLMLKVGRTYFGIADGCFYQNFYFSYLFETFPI